MMPDNLVLQHNASFSNASRGLRLDLSVNSTSIKTGEAIMIKISEHNLLPYSNRVNAESMWKVQLITDPCGSYFPMRFSIFQGYFTEGNILVAKPLQLYHGIPACTTIFLNIDSYVFEPLNNSAIVMGSYKGYSLTSPMPMQEVSSFTGFWTDWFPGVYVTAYLQSFASGSYTVAGGDEWGDLVLLYFTAS